MEKPVSIRRVRSTFIGLLSTSIVLSGCATSSSNVATAYVSPLQYQNYDCQQIIAEMSRVQVRVNQLAGRLDKAAENDKALVGVGMILFWPALFALGGTKEQEAEFARLKGEYEALEKAGNEKKCIAPVPPQPPPQAPIVPAAPAAAASTPA